MRRRFLPVLGFLAGMALSGAAHVIARESPPVSTVRGTVPVNEARSRASYASREADSTKLQEFRGGQGVLVTEYDWYILASVLVITLLILIILI